MAVRGIDHIALPIENVDLMVAFYRRLGCRIEETGAGATRTLAVFWGKVRFNFHPPARWKSADFALRGVSALPGCGDICLEWDGTIEAASAYLADAGITPELGPAPRTGARAGGSCEGLSLYFRDPDQNLLELIAYGADGQGRA